MKQLKIKAFCFVLTSFILLPYGCKKDLLNEQASTPFNQALSTPPYGYTTIQDYRNELRIIYADAVAKSLTDIEIRTFIKNKILLNKNIETELLHAKFTNETINDSMTFTDFLVKNSNKTSLYFTDTIPMYDPRLTILIPDNYNIQNWDTATFIPKVVVPPTEWDDTNAINLAYFDTSGRISDLNSNSQPTDLTIVIGETESLIPYLKPYTGENGPSNFDNQWYEYFLRNNIITFEGQSELVSQPNNDKVNRRSCSRDNSTKKDILSSVKINGESNLKALEHWTRGKAELLCIAIFNQSGTSPSASNLLKFIDVSRSDAKNEIFVSMNTEIIRWSNVAIMDRMKYAWFEDDGGKKTTITIPTTFTVGTTTVTLTPSVTISNENDNAGESIVEYCDEVTFGGTNYTTSRLTFNIKQ